MLRFFVLVSCRLFHSLYLWHTNIAGALIWFQEDRISETGKEAEVRESTLSAHACFLIKSMSQREDHIREAAVNLLTQLRDRFPQVN